jgi:hypothetical protein
MFDQGFVDMLCHFWGDNHRNCSEKTAFSCLFGRHQLKFIAKRRSPPRQPSAFFKDISACI